MIANLKNWLATPYYYNPSTKFKFKISLVYGLFVFLFLYTFQPFTLYSFKEYLLEYTSSIGLITFLGTFITLVVPPLIFKKYFKEDNWTIGKSILITVLGLFSIGTILWYYGKIFKADKDIEHIEYIAFIFYTFLVGDIPILFGVFFNEKMVRLRREKKAEEITAIKNQKEVEIKPTVPNKIMLKSDNKKESLIFFIEDLVYITSQGNYASFFIKNNKGELKEKILRVTLTKIVENLEEYPTIIRCHKSYIINTKYINGIKGNARGYLLESSLIPHQIPVSRNFSKKSLLGLIK